MYLFLRIDDLTHFQYGSLERSNKCYLLYKTGVQFSTISVVEYGERPHRVGDHSSQTRKLYFFWGPHSYLKWNFTEMIKEWFCSNWILIVTATDHNTICWLLFFFIFCTEHGLKIVYEIQCNLYIQLVNVFGNINNILEFQKTWTRFM